MATGTTDNAAKAPTEAKTNSVEPAAGPAAAHVGELAAGPWVAGATGIARLVSLIGGPLLMLAGSVGLYAAITARLGAQAGMEAIIVLAGLVGLLIGLRVMRGGIGLSLACIAGTVLIAAVLTDPSVRLALTSSTTLAPRAGLDMVLLFLVRASLSAAFGAAAIITVLERHPKRSLTLLAKAGAAAVPLLIVMAIWSLPAGRKAMTGGHPIITGFAATISLIAVCGLVAMVVHWTVQAFEAGRTLGRQPLGS